MTHMWVITLETWEKILLVDSERVNISYEQRYDNISFGVRPIDMMVNRYIYIYLFK